MQSFVTKGRSEILILGSSGDILRLYLGTDITDAHAAASSAISNDRSGDELGFRLVM